MTKKAFYSLLGSIAEQADWSVAHFGDGWVTHFQKGERTFTVHGHVYPLNTASAFTLARDKAAASEVLAAAGVPCIPHRLILRPDIAEQWYGFESSTVEGQLDSYIAKFGEDLVLKPNAGMSGSGVVHVESREEALRELSTIFPHQRDHALSPFIAHAREVRAIILDGEVLTLFEKEKGKDWRHNLAHGARAVPLVQEKERHEVTALAKRAVEVLGLRLASVDIFITNTEMQVIETNSGVMLEKMSDQLPDGKRVAKKIFEKIFFACAAL